MAIQFNIEHTDTFGGDANYCWVKRYTIDCDEAVSDLALVRRAKQLTGLSGYRARVEKYGDMIAIYPARICQVVFITVAC